MVEESLCDGRRKPCLTTALLTVLDSNAVRGLTPVSLLCRSIQKSRQSMLRFAAVSI